MNIDNPSVTFISTTAVTGNKLMITTRKIYKNTFNKKEAWPDFIAILEPAYKLSQAKVVLKKNSILEIILKEPVAFTTGFILPLSNQ